MANIAIIPARGGSKRIPHKNIKPFLGKPIIAYPIEAALQSGCFDAVIVSTDDPEIAEVAQRRGAQVPFMRPAELSDDHTPTLPVIRHALEHVDPEANRYDFACCIYSAAPFVTARQLAESFTKLKQSGANYVMPVLEHSAPIQRALQLSGSGEVSMFHPEHQNTRSQDLAKAYFDSGQFYWGTTHAFRHEQSILNGNTSAIVLPKGAAVDIDEHEDWAMAEALYHYRNEGRRE
ncbi:pseudaminic acid cytidylyltransferase [Aliagarivorans taiwanensis]|uniref:pseudaminic acid cytidylyltransferase n=1 Tax=Aliagarivorans taiwanensis TaxID=561966 RepID=UPI0003F6E4DF|nr:pseudaminic acid cytidylyltransferase [Aliagarivorans taiwanensis]